MYTRRARTAHFKQKHLFHIFYGTGISGKHRQEQCCLSLTEPTNPSKVHTFSTRGVE